MRVRHVLAIAALAAAASTVPACGEKKIESRPLDRALVVDGLAADWNGSEQFYDEQTGTKVAVFNDRDTLCICLSTWDAQTQQKVLMQGLTIWIDGEGGKRKAYGIAYPMGRVPGGPGEPGEMMEAGERIRPGEGDEGWTPPERTQTARISAKERARMLQERALACRYDLALGKTEQGEGRITTTDEARRRGVRAALVLDGGILVCEIAVPLGAAPGDPYGVPAEPGTTIGIGFETGSVRRRMEGQRPSGGPPPGGGMGGGFPGGGGMGGGRGGGMGPPGGRGGPGGSEPEPLELWLKVALQPAG